MFLAIGFFEGMVGIECIMVFSSVFCHQAIVIVVEEAADIRELFGAIRRFCGVALLFVCVAGARMALLLYLRYFQQLVELPERLLQFQLAERVAAPPADCAWALRCALVAAISPALMVLCACWSEVERGCRALLLRLQILAD